MRLWRISNHASLTGDGGLHASGRWHTRGHRVVYLSDHPASALVEVLVHLEIDAEDLPTHFQLLGVDVPASVRFDTVDTPQLPDNWRSQIAFTRARGDSWLKDRVGALLRVPSAIVPAAYNYLLNPAHADAGRLVIASAARAAFDPRLMAFVKG